MMTRLQNLYDPVREGVSFGFISGLVVLFLLLAGIPVNLANIGLLLVFVTMFVAGMQFTRRHFGSRGIAFLARNALALGVVAAVLVYLFLALLNRWQMEGIDVRKEYLKGVDHRQTMTVLSGVPVEELRANPAKDPYTGDYPEDAELRTDPMRLTFDRETGLVLKFGLSSKAWLEANLGIGGVYGFLLVLVITALLGAMLTWAAMRVEVGRRRAAFRDRFAGHPVLHWVAMVLPLLFFALLWLTTGHGGNDPVLRFAEENRELQPLLMFGIILFGLIAIRAAEPREWPLPYPARVGIVCGGLVVLALLAVWRITDNEVYLIPTSSDPAGSAGLTTLALLVVVGVLIVQNIQALQDPTRFEWQFAATLSGMLVLLLPLYLDQYGNDILIKVGIYVMMGLGLNIVVGYAGLLDLGYVAFFALGAYSYAFLSSNQQDTESGVASGLKFPGNDEAVIRIAGWLTIALVVTLAVVIAGLYLWRRWQVSRSVATTRQALIIVPQRPSGRVTMLLIVIAISVSALIGAVLDSTEAFQDVFGNASPFLVGLVGGVIAAGLSGIALGVPVLRLRGDYLAIVTLGFGEIIRLLFLNLRDYTGGPEGVLEIPRPVPADAAGQPVSYLVIAYLVLIGAALIAFFSMRLKTSRTGRAWSAMKSDEDIAQSMGVHLVQSKLLAFSIGASFAGIAGVIYAAYQRNIFPENFSLAVSINVLSLVIIGGMGSIPGVIMGAIVLIGMPEVLRELETYRVMALGALLVAMVIVRPEGILPEPPTQLEDKARSLALPSTKPPAERAEESAV
ncbi:MAG: hypothetical protein GYB65_00620 [Chloroflexi bacterium]|nr:hypothetical protein [Chloroflexota bacterium]